MWTREVSVNGVRCTPSSTSWRPGSGDRAVRAEVTERPEERAREPSAAACAQKVFHSTFARFFRRRAGRGRSQTKKRSIEHARPEPSRYNGANKSSPHCTHTPLNSLSRECEPRAALAPVAGHLRPRYLLLYFVPCPSPVRPVTRISGSASLGALPSLTAHTQASDRCRPQSDSDSNAHTAGHAQHTPLRSGPRRASTQALPHDSRATLTSLSRRASANVFTRSCPP